MPRQGVSGEVGHARFINHHVLQTSELGEHLELPRRVEALVSNVCQAPLIGDDDEFTVLQIAAPLINCH